VPSGKKAILAPICTEVLLGASALNIIFEFISELSFSSADDKNNVDLLFSSFAE